MATGDYAVGAVTHKAHSLSVSENPLLMPTRFVPGYNEELVIRDNDGNFVGMKTPWFSSEDPSSDEKYYYTPTNGDHLPVEIFNDIQDALTYIDPEDSTSKPLICDIAPGRISRIPAEGGKPAMLRVPLEKWINEYNYTFDNGCKANVFYLLDGNNVLSIVHAHDFTFMAQEKWELIVQLVYESDEAITNITEIDEDPNYFNIEMIELLTPDIVVGPAGRATDTIESFSDRFDTGSPGYKDLSGHKMLFLQETGALPNDLDMTWNNVRLDMANPAAVLDLAGNTLTLKGEGIRGRLNITDNVGTDGKLIISGLKANLEVSADTDDQVEFTTGSGSCMINGRLHLRDSGVCAEIEGNVNVTGDIRLGGDIRGHAIQELLSGGRAHFNDIDQYVRIPHHDELNPGTGDFCFQAVFRTDKDYSGGQGVLLGKGASGAAGYSLCLNSDNLLLFELSDGGSSVTAQSDKAMNDGRVHNVVIRGDRNGSLELWLDGTLQSDVKDCFSDSVINSEDVFLGYRNSSGSFFKGEIFLFRFWNQLMTDAQVREHSGNPLRELDYGQRSGSCLIELTPSGLGQPGIWRDGSGWHRDGVLEKTESMLTERFIDFGDQPDRIILTKSQQKQYAESPRILRYKDEHFVTRNYTAMNFERGDYIKVSSLESLTAPLQFTGDKLRIETARKFEISSNDMGGGIPYPIFVRGDNCSVDLWLEKSIDDLRSLGGDPAAMENRRVIKNQGKGNRIKYNNEVIFSGGTPMACLDFVLPNHPYLLEWDNAAYEGIMREDNSNLDKCWFAELYYWLDRRFNKTGNGRDTHEIVRVPPREASFLRLIDSDTSDKDPNRHSRASWITNPETITSCSSNGSTITLTGSDADNEIWKVKNGCRVKNLSDDTKTVIVQPGSIDHETKSFKIIDAETGNSVAESVSENLELDFGGMAAGSVQNDTFAMHSHKYAKTTITRYGSNLDVDSGWALKTDDLTTDDSGGDETRPKNMLAIPYYRL